MKEILLDEGERLDDLHINGYKIIQNEGGFCFGIDAVLLSDFAKAKKNNKVLDIGTGTGIIPILMEAKYKNTTYWAIEIQLSSYKIALKNMEYNNLSHKIKLINDDVKNIENYFDLGKFDIVTTNPPYMVWGNCKTNELEEKAIARHEIKCTLEDIIMFSEKMLKFGGKFYMVHRPNRMVDIFSLMRQYKIEPKVVRLVQPYEDSKPNIVLIEGVKGGKSSVEFLPNLIVYNKDGRYSDSVNKIYYGN